MLTLLSEATPFAIVAVCLLMLIGGTVFGLIADAILRDTGFGVAVNGVLILLGSILGVCVRLSI